MEASKHSPLHDYVVYGFPFCEPMWCLNGNVCILRTEVEQYQLVVIATCLEKVIDTVFCPQ
jgi:hypothetical protein